MQRALQVTAGFIALLAAAYGVLFFFAPDLLHRILRPFSRDGDPPIIIADSSVDVYIPNYALAGSSDAAHHHLKGLKVKSISQGTDDPGPVCSTTAACNGQTVTFHVQTGSSNRIITIQQYSAGSESGTDLMVTQPAWSGWEKVAKSDKSGYDQWRLGIGNLWDTTDGGQCTGCVYYVCFETSKNCPPGPMKAKR